MAYTHFGAVLKLVFIEICKRRHPFPGFCLCLYSIYALPVSIGGVGGVVAAVSFCCGAAIGVGADLIVWTLEDPHTSRVLAAIGFCVGLTLILVALARAVAARAKQFYTQRLLQAGFSVQRTVILNVVMMYVDNLLITVSADMVEQAAIPASLQRLSCSSICDDQICELV